MIPGGFGGGDSSRTASPAPAITIVTPGAGNSAGMMNMNPGNGMVPSMQTQQPPQNALPLQQQRAILQQQQQLLNQQTAALQHQQMGGMGGMMMVPGMGAGGGAMVPGAVAAGGGGGVGGGGSGWPGKKYVPCLMLLSYVTLAPLANDRTHTFDPGFVSMAGP